ncbi:S-adenosylmethionine--tRNA ribosyltransferase-isomerase [Neisseria gonorrhoeae]|uniref:S-adenosylmethionine--tRNA ribosyltransferase-isomerase n=1 Tax=Neisseria gonorrhoeae TaxID=485 RepID=A0A378W2M3_NEIGO|nr:S-adenosylmethionine--tRNA ribosyltransferase-isomerase [Neisseria gonorrhoeae]
MLVGAFSGMGHIRAVYRHAIEREYRFFSYGDAMVLGRNEGAGFKLLLSVARQMPSEPWFGRYFYGCPAVG